MEFGEEEYWRDINNMISRLNSGKKLSLSGFSVFIAFFLARVVAYLFDLVDFILYFSFEFNSDFLSISFLIFYLMGVPLLLISIILIPLGINRFSIPLGEEFNSKARLFIILIMFSLGVEILELPLGLIFSLIRNDIISKTLELILFILAKICLLSSLFILNSSLKEIRSVYGIEIKDLFVLYIFSFFLVLEIVFTIVVSIQLEIAVRYSIRITLFIIYAIISVLYYSAGAGMFVGMLSTFDKINTDILSLQVKNAMLKGFGEK